MSLRTLTIAMMLLGGCPAVLWAQAGYDADLISLPNMASAAVYQQPSAAKSGDIQARPLALSGRTPATLRHPCP